ncbi:MULTISPECIES: hypothetical protein [Serratia]|uniref:hypothetical protein n=1 Tax=Serratia TaxID=613 RepID=UPI001495E25E|nr:hypothetical protein [Serratia marcescens]
MAEQQKADVGLAIDNPHSLFRRQRQTIPQAAASKTPARILWRYLFGMHVAQEKAL